VEGVPRPASPRNVITPGRGDTWLRVDERANIDEGPAEDGARAAGDADPARLQHLEGQHRRLELVAKLVSHLSEPFGLVVSARLVREAGVLRHGSGDRGVEAAVQRVELLRADGPRRAHLAHEGERR
jgi:hypothetical protein